MEHKNITHLLKMVQSSAEKHSGYNPLDLAIISISSLPSNIESLTGHAEPIFNITDSFRDVLSNYPKEYEALKTYFKYYQKEGSTKAVDRAIEVLSS